MIIPESSHMLGSDDFFSKLNVELNTIWDLLNKKRKTLKKIIPFNCSLRAPKLHYMDCPWPIELLILSVVNSTPRLGSAEIS